MLRYLGLLFVCLVFSMSAFSQSFNERQHRDTLVKRIAKNFQVTYNCTDSQYVRLLENEKHRFFKLDSIKSLNLPPDQRASSYTMVNMDYSKQVELILTPDQWKRYTEQQSRLREQAIERLKNRGVTVQ